MSNSNTTAPADTGNDPFNLGKPERSRVADERILRRINEMARYLESDCEEERHYEENGKPADHIWTDVEAVLNWLFPDRAARIEHERFMEREHDLFQAWLKTPDGRHWQKTAPWRTAGAVKESTEAAR